MERPDECLRQAGDIPYLAELPPEGRLRLGFSAYFARSVTSRRKALGRTQEELAARSGVNRVTIAKLETCQRLASISVVLKLLDALDLDIRFAERAPGPP